MFYIAIYRENRKSLSETTRLRFDSWYVDVDLYQAYSNYASVATNSPPLGSCLTYAKKEKIFSSKTTRSRALIIDSITQWITTKFNQIMTMGIK